MKLENSGVDTGSRGFFALLVVMAGLFAWTAVAPCLDNGFTNWDERRYIIENPKIRDLSPAGVKTMFASRDLGMYSPLAALSHAVNYRFSGLKPRAYHATDIVLHLLNTALVMVFVRLLLGGPWPAFLCGLLFGAHPAHIESVAWAAERKDLLYALFYLLALCVYASGRGLGNRLAVFGLFLLSLLAKPMAATLPLALLLVDYFQKERLERRDWLEKLPFFAASLAAAAVLVTGGGESYGWAPLYVRVSVAFYNLGFYIYKLAWPFSLSAMYAMPPGGPAVIYLGALAAAAAGALLLKYRRRDKVLMFGAGFYLVSLLPVLQLFPFGPSISADRYTYLSSIGVFIAASAAGLAAFRRFGANGRRALAAAAVLLVFSFTIAARLRCGVWADSVTLWTDTVRKQPAAGQALVSLCAAYLQCGQLDDAEECLAKAVHSYPRNEDNRYNLGVLAARRGDFARARKQFGFALGLNPRHAPALHALADLPK